MKIFLDTADLTEIQKAAAQGLLDGVTTNPTLMAKALGGGITMEQVLKKICDMIPATGSVSAEVLSIQVDEMVAEGRKYAKIAPNITVKVPLTPDGIWACRQLSAEGIKVNVTLCFSSTQALLAAKAGATYISPFVGRLDDISQDGMQLIQEIRTIYDNYGYTTQILAASIRHPLHVAQAALAGADVATMPGKVLWQLFKHPLTDAGLAAFLADWEKSKKS